MRKPPEEQKLFSACGAHSHGTDRGGAMAVPQTPPPAHNLVRSSTRSPPGAPGGGAAVAPNNLSHWQKTV